jgi:hypothetical protein
MRGRKIKNCLNENNLRRTHQKWHCNFKYNEDEDSWLQSDSQLVV